VEVVESIFFDEMKKQRALVDNIKKRLAKELGIGVNIKLVEEKTLERFNGKQIHCSGRIPAFQRSQSGDLFRGSKLDQRKCRGAYPKTTHVYLQTTGKGSLVANATNTLEVTNVAGYFWKDIWNSPWGRIPATGLGWGHPYVFGCTSCYRDPDFT
jgi:hypothetical protein